MVSLLKCGIKPLHFHKATLEKLPFSKLVSAENKNNVAKLLTTMFQENWHKLPGERFIWYKSIINKPSQPSDDDVICNGLENDNAIKI